MTNPAGQQDFSANEPPPPSEVVESPIDPVPPPDHGGFVEARSNGLLAVRANLARRRKSR